MIDFLGQTINPLLIFKIIFLIADLFYVFFLFVVLNRVISMNQIVKDAHDEMILKSIAVFKVFLAISLFLLALAVL